MLTKDLLRWALVGSVLFHICIVLGISFVMPAQSETPVIGPPLRITLVSTPSDKPPEESDIVAQANSSGEAEPDAALPETSLDARSSVRQQTDLTAQREIFTVDRAEHSAGSDDANAEAAEFRQSREQLRAAISLAYLNAQAQPREAYVSARAKQNKYAAYVEKWRLLVERVGNANYPEAAKQQGIEGSLVLDVAIAHDGTVSAVRVLSSSGEKILDDAAVRIVHIAAPFDQFPDAIRQDVDILHIVRTWQFGENAFISTVIQ